MLPCQWVSSLEYMSGRWNCWPSLNFLRGLFCNKYLPVAQSKRSGLFTGRSKPHLFGTWFHGNLALSKPAGCKWRRLPRFSKHCDQVLAVKLMAFPDRKAPPGLTKNLLLFLNNPSQFLWFLSFPRLISVSFGSTGSQCFLVFKALYHLPSSCSPAEAAHTLCNGAQARMSLPRLLPYFPVSDNAVSPPTIPCPLLPCSSKWCQPFKASFNDDLLKEIVPDPQGR